VFVGPERCVEEPAAGCRALLAIEDTDPDRSLDMLKWKAEGECVNNTPWLGRRGPAGKGGLGRARWLVIEFSLPMELLASVNDEPAPGIETLGPGGGGI